MKNEIWRAEEDDDDDDDNDDRQNTIKRAFSVPAYIQHVVEHRYSNCEFPFFISLVI
jgi:hypothetical protein